MMTPIETQVAAPNRLPTMQQISVGDPPPYESVEAQQYSVRGTEMAPGSSQTQYQGQLLQPQPQAPPFTYTNQTQQPQAKESGYEQPAKLFIPQPIQPGFVHVQQPVSGPSAGQAAGYLAVSGTASLQGPTAERNTTVPIEWMPKPVTDSTYCPPGLEYLLMVDHLILHQLPTIAENVMLGGRVYRFSVQNSLGQQVYFAEVTSGQPLGNAARREVMFRMTDSFGQVVIKIDHRVPKCGGIYCSGCCSGCGVVMLVEAPPGQAAGTVAQQPSVSFSTYLILDAQGSAQLRIEGPRNFCVPTADVYTPQEFGIFSTDLKQVLGKVSRREIAMLQSLMAPVQISMDLLFPMDLDVKMKATLLGAAFTLFYYHLGIPSSPRSSRDHHHHHHVGSSTSGGSHHHHAGISSFHRSHHHHVGFSTSGGSHHHHAGISSSHRSHHHHGHR